MNSHKGDDFVGRFSRGKLYGAELTDCEQHLPQRDQCQDAVRRMDLLLEAMRGAAEHSPQSDRLIARRPKSTS
jgi:hypothetical protein